MKGVLNEYGKEKFDEKIIPKIKSGAKEFIQNLSQYAELYLFTTRNLILATKWLMKNDLDKTIFPKYKSGGFFLLQRLKCHRGYPRIYRPLLQERLQSESRDLFRCVQNFDEILRG